MLLEQLPPDFRHKVQKEGVGLRLGFDVLEEGDQECHKHFELAERVDQAFLDPAIGVLDQGAQKLDHNLRRELIGPFDHTAEGVVGRIAVLELRKVLSLEYLLGDLIQVFEGDCVLKICSFLFRLVIY